MGPSVFPDRIDPIALALGVGHHVLQAALLLGAMLALARQPGEGAGFAAGLLAAASLLAGPDTVPLLGAIGAMAVAEWTSTGNRDRLLGLGIGAATGLAIGRGLFVPAGWEGPARIGLAALPPAAAVFALAAMSPSLPARRQRVAAGLVAGMMAGGVSLALWWPRLRLSLEPSLARLWLAEAGVTAIGLAVMVWRLRIEPAATAPSCRECRGRPEAGRIRLDPPRRPHSPPSPIRLSPPPRAR